MRDEPIAAVKVSKCSLIRYQKGCWFIQTAWMWPWKPEPSKKCVTAYKPNELAPKMDDAQANHLDRAIGLRFLIKKRPMSRRAWCSKLVTLHTWKGKKV